MSKRWQDLQPFHTRVKCPSLDELTLTFEDTSIDDDLLIKLAGMTRALPPVSTFAARLPELDQFADGRIHKRGDGVLGGAAPEHVCADPEHWGEPGRLDDLLDKISGARRKVSDKANKALHADAIRARDVARYQRKDRRDSVIKSVEQWRAKPENKVAEQLRKIEMSAVDYHRPFVILDSEGCDHGGHDITRGGVTFKDHGTFLWAAMPWLRDYVGTGHKDHSGRQGRDGLLSWIGNENKSFLLTPQVFDWMLDLPGIYGNANFCIFSGGYDFGQLLHPRSMSWKAVKEICKDKKFKTGDEADADADDVRGYHWWHPYGLSAQRRVL